MGAALLSVEDLTIAFPKASPVRSLSFTVEAGETVAIVGESGSGKSLTGLAVMGLLPPGASASGAIRFEGQDVAALAEPALRRIRGARIAMIFQEPMTSLNPVMTIGRQIGEVLRLHEGLSARAARARAIDLLDLVRVSDPHRRVDDYPHRLSGGMRQRVMIAIAVACSPKLLIADEPTTALDVTIQAQVLDLIDRLRRVMGMGLVLITHDLGVVGQWSDRVVVMYAGRKVEEAAPDALFANPRHPYTQGLIGASPRSGGTASYRDGPLREIRGGIASAAGAGGCPFAPRCDRAVAGCSVHVPELRTVGPRRLAACPVLNPAEATHAPA